MGSKNKKEFYDHFTYPLCIVNGQPPYLLRLCNSAFQQLTGGECESIVGKHLNDNQLVNIFSGQEEVISNFLKNIENNHKPANLVLNIVGKSESTDTNDATWLLEVSPLNDPDLPDSLLLTFHEISKNVEFSHTQSLARELLKQESHQRQTRALKDQVHSKQRQFQAAADELNNFVYSVSHDLRAPLRRIDGFSQELVHSHADQLDETGLHFLQRIRQGAQDMGILIDELLKLSRISRQEIQREPVEVAKLVKTVFDELMELEKSGQQATLTITANNTYVHADPGLVKVVITNLLSNALKFSSKKERSIIELGEKTIEGHSYLYIKDNGVGFDPAHSDKLFRAFNRLHTQRDFAGIGIGLATVSRIMQLHAGHIFAQSTPGEGATFYFNFHKSQ
jgi:signal transduction histidine kinase